MGQLMRITALSANRVRVAEGITPTHLGQTIAIDGITREPAEEKDSITSSHAAVHYELSTTGEQGEQVVAVTPQCIEPTIAILVLTIGERGEEPLSVQARISV